MHHFGWTISAMTMNERTNDRINILKLYVQYMHYFIYVCVFAFVAPHFISFKYISMQIFIKTFFICCPQYVRVQAPVLYYAYYVCINTIFLDGESFNASWFVFFFNSKISLNTVVIAWMRQLMLFCKYFHQFYLKHSLFDYYYGANQTQQQ